MGRTANLRRQHDEATDLVGQLFTIIDGPQPDEAGIYRMGHTIARLTGMLRIHFAIESRSLYPYMTSSSHVEAATTAAAFQDEMGGLNATYMAYADRWNNRMIASNWQTFRSERENMTLYPLAEAISDNQIRQSS
jgi:hypothetical protein